MGEIDRWKDLYWRMFNIYTQEFETANKLSTALDRAIEEIYNVRGHKHSREEIKKELMGENDELTK